MNEGTAVDSGSFEPRVGAGRPAPAPDTWMWEASAAAGRADDLVTWLSNAVKAVADAGTGAEVAVYRSVDQVTDRVVAIVTTSASAPGAVLPEVPAGLVERPPHGWAFVRVR